MYALIAAHLAQLILNWHNDAFVLRQRLNLCGDKNVVSRPEAVAGYLPYRWIRLIVAGVALFTTLKFNWCSQKPNELCDTDTSHSAHTFGALGGLLTGLIFLRARSFKKPIYLLKNILFIFVYGLSVCYIINKYFFETYKNEGDKCPWIEYERVCQSQCYLEKCNESLNCTVNLCNRFSRC